MNLPKKIILIYDETIQVEDFFLPIYAGRSVVYHLWAKY
jgi:hypothetical protein